MILVVGGSGRLGRLVVEELTAHHEVRVLARHTTTAVPPMAGCVDLVDGDVRDPDAVAAAARGASCIVVASHGVESRERCGVASVDDLGSRAAANAARAVGCSVVLVSIIGAAPDAPMQLARTKWVAEQNIRASGVPWTIVRAAPFAQTWAMILTMSAGRSGRPAIIGPGQAPHRFADVRDVAQVVARAATDVALRGRVLGVSGPEELSVSQLAAMVQEAYGRSGAPRHLPVPVARVIAPALALFRPDLARRLSIGIAMNDRPTADDGGADVPDWIVPRPVTAETMGGASKGSAVREG